MPTKVVVFAKTKWLWTGFVCSVKTAFSEISVCEQDYITYPQINLYFKTSLPSCKWKAK